jgi:AcrR family transcriptional regulator
MDFEHDSSLSRRERKKRETRKRILDAALALTANRPYGEVRIEDICSAADVANATFFLHFANKQALVRAFGAQITSRLQASALDPALTSADQLEKLLESYIEQWRDHRNLMHEVVLEFVSKSEGVTSFNEVAPGLLDLVGQTIRRGQARGEFLGSIEPKIVALALVAAWNAIAISSSVSADRALSAKALWQTLDLFLAGLKPAQAHTILRLQTKDTTQKTG